MSAGIWGLFLALMLSSCKTPVSFAEEFTSKTSEETSTDDTADDSTDDSDTVPDSEVVGEVCDQLDSDSHNASLANVLLDPFIDLSFSSLQGLKFPRGSCVTRTVLEDEVLRRVILLQYSCEDVKGSVRIQSEQEELGGTVTSKVDTNVVVYSKESIRTVQSSLTHLSFVGGATQIDREFNVTYGKDGLSHQITGVLFYDFIPDEAESHNGVGFVDVSGNISHMKEGIIENVYSLTSAGLHRDRCGFDDGSVILRSSRKETTATYKGCGQPAITQAAP